MRDELGTCYRRVGGSKLHSPIACYLDINFVSSVHSQYGFRRGDSVAGAKSWPLYATSTPYKALLHISDDSAPSKV